MTKKVEYDQFFYYGRVADITLSHKKILSITEPVVGEEGLVSDFFDIKKEGDTLTAEDANRYTLFPGEIKKIAQDNVLISNKGIIINLPLVYGASKYGQLQYVADTAKFKQDPSSFNVKDKIVVTDVYDVEMYPVVSAMGARALVVFAGDYDHISTAYHTYSSFALVYGYGKDFTRDALYKYIKSADSKYAWLDTLFNRLIIVDKSQPFIEKYEFDIDAIMGYK